MDRNSYQQKSSKESLMKPEWWLAIFSLALLVGCQSPTQSPHEVFEAFDSALQNSEMHKLDDLVSENSVRYFRGLQPWIVRGDEESLMKLPLFDRYLVLYLRMNLDSLTYDDWRDWNDILESDSKSHAVSGYLREALEEIFHKTSLGKVDSVNGITAGQLYRMGSPTGLSLRFTNEKGWKIELSRLFHDQFEQTMAPYLSDRYNNRDRVWEMLSERYGERANRSLFRSRIAKDPSDA